MKSIKHLLLALVLASLAPFAHAANPDDKFSWKDKANSEFGFIDSSDVIQGLTINGNAATATALAANGANCSAGSAPLGTDASGAVEGCFDVETAAEATAHEGDASAHHTATVNTNAATICSGTGNYLDGEGNCDPLVTDTGAPHGNGANCSAGSAPEGVDASGAVEACFDVETAVEATAHEGDASAHHTATVNTDASTKCSAGEYLSGTDSCDTLSTGAHTTSASDLTSGTLADARLVWFFGQRTSTQLTTDVPDNVGQVASNTTDFDLYTATATSAGSWRNSRTGVAPSP